MYLLDAYTILMVKQSTQPVCVTQLYFSLEPHPGRPISGGRKSKFWKTTDTVLFKTRLAPCLFPHSIGAGPFLVVLYVGTTEPGTTVNGTVIRTNERLRAGRQ